MNIIDIIKEIWRVFSQASPYILFGLFIAGLIQIFIDKDKIVKYLGKPGLRSVFLAALCGVPLPLCSCGVIPTAISLRKNGASKGATLSFLISTPESSVDSIAISYALLDPIMTIVRPIAAFFTAMIAGLAENLFGRKDKDKSASGAKSCVSCENNEKKPKITILGKFKHGMRYAFIDLLGDISKWLVWGIIIAGLISYFVPQNLIERYLGNDWWSMFIVLLVGIPLYICATASTPLAAALIAKGMSPGVALVFLLVGPATNVAGMFTVGKFLGKRSVAIYLISISVCAVVLGLLLNQIYFMSGIDIRTTIGKAGSILPTYVKTISAIILIMLIAKISLNAYSTRRKR